MTINSVGKTDLNDRESEYQEEEALNGESSRLSYDLLEFLEEALQAEEMKRNDELYKQMSKSVVNAIKNNKDEIVRAWVAPITTSAPKNTQLKYYQ